MANLSALPDVQCLVYPEAAIPQKIYPGFVVADVLGDRMNLGLGDSQGLGIENMNPTVSLDWMGGTAGVDPNSFVALDGVQFVRFMKDGTFREGASAHTAAPTDKSELSGFILKARDGLLDCKIGDSALDTEFFDINWVSLQGTHETVLPPDPPQRCFFRNVGSGLTHKARMVGDLPACRSLRWDVRFATQKRNGPQPAFRAGWANDTYSIVLRHGMKPSVEMMVNGQWCVLRTLDNAPLCDLNRGRYVIRVRRIAGYLVVSINNYSAYFLATTLKASGRRVPVDFFWQEGKLSVNTYNVRATVGLALIKYAEPNDDPFSGYFVRQLQCHVPILSSERSGGAVGKTSGWKKADTSATASAGVGSGTLTYTCTLTASPEGIDTPFVSKVLCDFSTQWRAASRSPIDIRRALKSVTVDLAMPPIMPGTEMTVEVDRADLDKWIPGWEENVQQYCPIELLIRRRYDDGTTDDEWVRRFKGYIYRITKARGGVNSGTMTLYCRNAILRLQKPAAVIDHRYPPLDFIFAFMDSNVADPTTLQIWGSDGVKEILRRTLGDSAADSLNGTGDGERYFSNHYPLVDFSGDTAGYFGTVAGITGQPPTQNGFLFPPPFGEYAIDWINKIAAYDHAVFYYGWPGGYVGDWEVPIYGRIVNILAGMGTVTIPDREYISGDLNRLLLSLETETRPDRDINRWLVWANPGGATAPAFIPAIRMAEARLLPDDINAPERTWERTEVIREDLASPVGGAEGVALGRAMLQRNVEMLWPRLVVRGNPYLTWGHKTLLKMQSASSDASIKLNGKTFRAEKVTDTITFGANEIDPYKTTLYVRPLSSNGI